MLDEPESGSRNLPSTTSKKVLGEAEAKRQARRRRILGNEESRLQKILGAGINGEESARRIVASSNCSIISGPDDEPVLPEEFLTLDKLRFQQQQDQNISTLQRRQVVGGNRFTLLRNHRMLIAALGAILPFLKLNYLLIYFFLVEIGILMYLRRIPIPPATQNILFTLAVVMGINEDDVQKLKLVVRFSSWILSDLSIFILSSILPQLVVSQIYSQG